MFHDPSSPINAVGYIFATCMLHRDSVLTRMKLHNYLFFKVFYFNAIGRAMRAVTESTIMAPMHRKPL
jgi:hypothetical protein